MSSTSSENPKTISNVIVRVVTALILTPAVLFLMVQGGWFFAIPMLFFAFLGTLEGGYMTTHRHMESRVRILAICSVLYAALVEPLILDPRIALFAVVCLVLIFFIIMLAPHGQPLNKSTWVAMLMIMAYVATICAFAIALRNHPFGLGLWFLIVTGTWSMDTFSYVGGRAYGKTKLAERISPKKTVEGAVTGYIGSISLNLIILTYLGGMNGFLIMLILGIPIVALFGDLFMSKFKRMYHVKDSFVPGINIIPGHGGLLDRIDSTFLVVVYVFTITFIVMPF